MHTVTKPLNPCHRNNQRISSTRTCRQITDDLDTVVGAVRLISLTVLLKSLSTELATSSRLSFTISCLPTTRGRKKTRTVKTHKHFQREGHGFRANT